MKDKPFKLNGRKGAKLSDTIIVESSLRINPDIGKWRSALRNAEDEDSPDRSTLYDIYKETILDGLVTSVTQRISSKCTNSKIIFKKEGEADKEHPISKMCQTPMFLEIISEIVASKWYGHSLIELDFNDKELVRAELLPRKNVIPEKGLLVKNVGEQEGINYREPPYLYYVLDVGKRKDLGLLNNATPYTIYKRFGISSWGEYVERYGLPIQEYQYDTDNPNARKEVEQQAKEQGSGARIIMPKGTETKLHKGADGSGSTVFVEYRGANNEEIALIFLLQTMTTMNGSSRSQAEVHEGGEDELIAGYKLFVEMVLNFQLKPILEKHGLDVEGGEFKYEDTEKLSKKELLDIFKGLSNFGVVPLDVLEKHFGIKLTPKEKEAIKEDAAKEKEVDEDKSKIGSKKKNRYNLACNCLVDEKNLTEQLRFSEKEENSLIKRIYGYRGKNNFDPIYFNQLSQGLMKELDDGWNASKGIDYESADHLSRTLLELNLYRFSATKDVALIQEANKFLNTSKNFHEFEQQTADLFKKYNKNHLRTEYNLANATAQNTSSYLRNLEVAEDFPYWEYQTVGDDRVRPAHAALDGMLFRAGETGIFTSPNGFGCRCEHIPRDTKAGKRLIDEDEAAELLGEEFDKMKEAGFAVNRASGGFVFNEDQMYVNNFAEEGLGYKSFNLPEYSEIKAKATEAIKTTRTEAKAKEWFAGLTNKNDLNKTDRVRLLDYNKRPTHLDLEVLLKNKSWNILDLIPKVLENPDEVYFKRTKEGYKLTLLQHYNPKPLVAELLITKKDTTITSWSFASNVKKARTGLLIKKQ